MLEEVAKDYVRDPNMRLDAIKRSITPQGFAKAFFKANIQPPKPLCAGGEEKYMIIVILKAGLLEGKMKLPKRQNEIQIVLPLPVKANWWGMENLPEIKTTPRAVFIWWRQISKLKHEYRLTEILQIPK